MGHNIVVSFVHGYEDQDLRISGEDRPALLKIANGKSRVYKYVFPRNPADFGNIGHVLSGTRPLESARDFKKLPRFGFTGLRKYGGCFYAGSYNGVYEIDAATLELRRIISNELMSNPHGISVDGNGIITILTSKDTLVLSDFDGNIIDHYMISNDLTVHKDEKLPEIDWRFISKQFTGSCGYWHFNYVQRFGSEIWLTSRSASCFVVLNLKTRKAHLRLMNLLTPVLLHDGLFCDGKYYFTSIDGKIVIAEDGNLANRSQRTKESVDNLDLYNRDLVADVIRLSETELARKPNWCRGLACKDGIIYVTIDGRYDTELSFGVIGLKDGEKIVLNKRLHWSEVGSTSQLRYVTGFDILAL